MPRCRVLILTALLMEARAIARAFSLPAAFTSATGSNGDITVAMVGMRARRLGQVAAEIEPQGVIMAGLAGGLCPTVKVGDVILDGDIAGFVAAGELPRVHFGGLH